MKADLPIIVITGATASGKTKLAVEFAKKYNAQIICADSRIVYKGFDIVSAKPNLEDQDGVKHHLIDILDADKNFSAGDFVQMAQKIIKEIHDANQNVVICGGTWFYIKALLDKEAMPEIPPDYNLRGELDELDSLSLWKKLQTLDSQRAQEIHANNKEKLIRSIEMCLHLGYPVSRYVRPCNRPLDTLWFIADYSREEIYERINLRVDEMANRGLYEEFKKNDKKFSRNKIMYSTIGYKEFYDYKDKTYKSLDETFEKIKQHTRNFAKRQLTWFRQNENMINKIKPDVCEIEKFIN